MIEFLVTIVFLAACWYGYKAWIIRSAGPKAIPRRISTEDIYEWPDEGYYDFDIVGESYYQKALKRFAGQNDEHVDNREYRALLIPEYDNRYDSNAIRVDINGATIGYISRENAGDFRDRLESNQLTGQITACKAIVTGGGERDGEKWWYGARLNLKEFE